MWNWDSRDVLGYLAIPAQPYWKMGGTDFSSTRYALGDNFIFQGKIGRRIFAGRNIACPILGEAVASEHVSNHSSTCYSEICILFNTSRKS
jgi:hypothetical protein